MENENKGLISVIIPCFNQANYISQAIESLLKQSYTEWECIIVDDGSDDNTESIVDKYRADKRIQYTRKKNGGVSSARNAGLGLAKGMYIQFLDGDDFLDSSKFEDAINAFSKNDCDVVISDFEMYDQRNGKTFSVDFQLNRFNFSYETVLLDWEKEFVIPIHCGIIKKKLLENFKFREDIRAYEDWILWLHVFKNAGKGYHFVNKKQAIYRRGINGATQDFLFLVENRKKATAYIMTSLNEDLKMRFFEKVNDDWSRECIGINQKLETLQNTTGYKIGSKLAFWASKTIKFIKNDR